MEVEVNKPKNWSWIWIIVIVVILGIAAYVLLAKRPPHKTETQNPSTRKTVESSWRERGVAIEGKFADADIVDFGGKYRMYYAVEPEVAGNNLEIYSAVSTDGITWAKEDGTRKTFATFPDVLKLSDGNFRMYFQNAGVIKSATSTDGLAWKDEPGSRVDKNETGFNLESVGAQSTTRLPDGSFVMIYRGTVNEPYKTTQMIPNKNTQLYFWATSKDGLTFEKKGIAIDSRNETLYGLADGGEWVNFDGELRAYFWSYTGVYHSVFKDDSFSAPVFDWTNNKNSQIKFAENPPGDPTIIKIAGKWFMFFGQHTKGIYYATLE